MDIPVKHDESIVVWVETEREARNGMCLSCGAIETLLNKVSGYRDLSHIGEHPRYPTGFGCELCD